MSVLLIVALATLWLVGGTLMATVLVIDDRRDKAIERQRNKERGVRRRYGRHEDVVAPDMGAPSFFLFTAAFPIILPIYVAVFAAMGVEAVGVFVWNILHGRIDGYLEKANKIIPRTPEYRDVVIKQLEEKITTLEASTIDAPDSHGLRDYVSATENLEYT